MWQYDVRASFTGTRYSKKRRLWFSKDKGKSSKTMGNLRVLRRPEFITKNPYLVFNLVRVVLLILKRSGGVLSNLSK